MVQWHRFFLACYAGLAGCFPVFAAELRVAVSRGPVSLPFFVAEANGYFKAEGLIVRQVECGSGRECFQKMQSGSADLATSAELIVALDSLKAGSATIIASISNSAQHIKLVARRSAGISAPADLRGKRIGTVAKTSAQYFLENWLLYHAIGSEQVQIVPTAVDDLLGELQSRHLDAIAIWEPIAAEATAWLGADRAALGTPRVYTQNFVLSIVRSKLPVKEADVHRLLRGLLRAEQFIAEHINGAASILASRLGLDPAAALAALSEHDYRLELTPTLLSTMDGQARWAIRERLVDTPQTSGAVTGAVAPDLLRTVSPKAVSLPRR